MKKLIALALTLISLTWGVAAIADEIPKASINPQQQGHVAFLESQYGERRTEQILSEYRKPHSAAQGKYEPPISSQVPVLQEYPVYDYDYVYEIPQPVITGSDLSRLNVGEYFYMGGNRYIVGRFGYVGGARVLVAFPADANGYADPTNPRYFYL